VYIESRFKLNLIAILSTCSGIALLFLSVLGFNQHRWVKNSLLALGLAASAGGKISRQISQDMGSANLDYQFAEKLTRLTTLTDPLPVLEGQFVEATPALGFSAGKLPQLIEPPSDWLINICLLSVHFRVNGQTGSGKSTFVLMLINLLVKGLEVQNIDVEIIIIDPKYPFSDWGIYTPRYKGLEESLDGLTAMSETVIDRLDKARKSADRKQPLPKFRPQLWVIDEIDMIMSEYQKEGAKHLKIGLKVGRALGIKICYVGQSPLSSDLRLRRNDFNNSTNIFLGSNGLAGVDEICYTKSQKDFLLGQLAVRESQEQKYFALVKAPSLPPFTAKLPSASPKLPSASSDKLLEDVEDTPSKGLALPSDKLEAIKTLKNTGEDRLSVIICTVWGLTSAGGRSYQAAREEYRKLTGD